MTSLDTATTEPAPGKPRSFWSRLYHGETTFDFVGRRRIGFLVSGLLILVTLVSLFTRGMNLGLDFKGGVAWTAPAKNGLTLDSARTVLSDNGLNPAQAKVQTLSAPSGTSVRVEVSAQTQEKQNAVRLALATKAGVDQQEVSLDSVSSTWGSEITKAAVKALIIFFVLLFIYVSFRFEWKMAIGAIVAVIHDVLISVGIYSVFGFEVTPATVIAFLTILGFSLYDTIVVFDKVHENTRRFSGGRATYGDIVNLSMNQVLMRSINTTLAAVLPVLSLLVVGAGLLGAVALTDFALALLVGLVIGAYSSIFVATPILAMLKQRFEPRYRQLREKWGTTTGELIGTKAGEAPTRATRAGAVATPGGPVTAGPTPAAGGFTHPPRPRKKRR